jgi:hypothetical protein
MNNQFTNYIVKENQIYCVHQEEESHYVVFDRLSKTGVNYIAKTKVSELFDSTSKEFETLKVDFLRYLSCKLFKVANKDIDEVPHDVALMYVITQCFEDSTFIMDYDQYSENYIDECCEETIKYLGKTVTPQKYLPVKLYIIEQILQKHYCHKFNDEWIENKKANYQFDLYTGPKVAILC